MQSSSKAAVTAVAVAVDGSAVGGTAVARGVSVACGMAVMRAVSAAVGDDTVIGVGSEGLWARETHAEVATTSTPSMPMLQIRFQFIPLPLCFSWSDISK